MRALRKLLRTPSGLFSVTVLALVVVTVAMSLVWLPHDPLYAPGRNTWAEPSLTHWLGTDQTGRDLASRLLVGSQVTVLVALGTGLLAGLVGLTLAVPQALGNRFVREPLAIIIDVLIAFPTLLLAIMLTAVFGSGLGIVIVSVGIGYGVQVARVLRAELRQVAQADFVLAARAAGLSRLAILRKHLLPSVSPVLIVQLSLSMGLAVLAESGLSFLGFGAAPNMPSWGRVLAETKNYIGVHPEIVFWPGLTITLVVLAFFLLGDRLREILDPSLTPEDIERQEALGVQA